MKMLLRKSSIWIVLGKSFIVLIFFLAVHSYSTAFFPQHILTQVYEIGIRLMTVLQKNGALMILVIKF